MYFVTKVSNNCWDDYNVTIYVYMSSQKLSLLIVFDFNLIEQWKYLKH